MKVFVVIATYNASKWIVKCLESVKRSSVLLDVVIVDNNSTDDTVSLIKEKFGDYKLIEQNNNLGFGKANNIGIDYAIGQSFDFILLLNQDAYLFADTVQKLIEQSILNPGYFVLSPVHLDGSSLCLDYWFSKYLMSGNNHDVLSRMIVKNDFDKIHSIRFVNAAIWFMTKECIAKVGVFDPIFPHYGEDEDYIHRVSYHGGHVGICLNTYAVHDRNQIRTVEIVRNTAIRDKFSTLFSMVRYPNNNIINRRYVGYLVELKKLNVSLFNLITKFILNVLFSLFGNIVKFKINSVISEFIAVIRVVANIKNVYVSREVSRKFGAFLKIN